MKFISLNSLFASALQTLKRFPIALFFACLGSSLAIHLMSFEPNVKLENQIYFNLISSTYLGMLLFTALSAGLEKIENKFSLKIGIQVAGLLLIAAYYSSLSHTFQTLELIRFLLFSLGLHLLISFIPFLTESNEQHFWQYNKTLFIRILNAALYSAVLYIGLVLALLAIDNLLTIKIDKKVYGYLWVYISGIFNTWFFLSGFPNPAKSSETVAIYPKGLKIFTQYVLIPLISVYLIILYAYQVKIIIHAEWPMGWVSYLVLGFSIGGILSLLLIYPVRNEAGNRWIVLFSRFFYFALFPLVVLLFFAIKRRITDYGITENRYFVLLLALWLLFIASYFLISKVKNIKLIPLSLCIVAFASSFGPWGAFDVSKRSQQNRLTTLTTKYKLEKGKFSTAQKTISTEDKQELNSIIHYLVSMHGYQAMQPFVRENLDSLIKPISSDEDSYFYTSRQENTIDSLLGINYSVEAEPADYFEYRCNSEALIENQGANFLIPDYEYEENTNYSTWSDFKSDKQTFSLSFEKKGNVLKLIGTSIEKPITVKLTDLVSSIRNQKFEDVNDIPVSTLTLRNSNDSIVMTTIIKSISGIRMKSKIEIQRIHATILIQFKASQK